MTPHLKKIRMEHSDGYIEFTDFETCSMELSKEGDLRTFKIEAAFYNLVEKENDMKKPYAKPAETKKEKPKKKAKKK